MCAKAFCPCPFVHANKIDQNFCVNLIITNILSSHVSCKCQLVVCDAVLATKASYDTCVFLFLSSLCPVCNYMICVKFVACLLADCFG
jgi:hypothetical protein